MKYNNTLINFEVFFNVVLVVGNQKPVTKGTVKNSLINYSLKNGVEESDLTTVDIFNFIADNLLKYKVSEMALITAWFGDVDAADVDASSAGVLTSGTNEAYFNKIDGLWSLVTCEMLLTKINNIQVIGCLTLFQYNNRVYFFHPVRVR